MKHKKRVSLLVAVFLAATLLPPLPAMAQEAAFQLDDAFHEHGAAMMLLDPDSGKILYVNNAAAEFYGYSKGALTAMNLAELNAEGAEPAMRILLSGGEEKGYVVLTQRLASGDLRDMELYFYHTEHNGVRVLSCVFHDVTQKLRLEKGMRSMVSVVISTAVCVSIALLLLLLDLKRKSVSLANANRELVNIRSLWETFYNADASYVYLKDENLNFVLVNQAFKELYQLPYDQIVGHNDYDLLEDEYAQAYMESDREALEQNRKLVRVAPWKHKVFRTTKFPVRLMDGSRGVGAYVADITEEHGLQRGRERELKRNKLLLEVFSRNFRDAQELFDYVLEEMLKLSGSQYGYIYTYDEASAEFHLNSWTRGVMRDCDIAHKQSTYKLTDTGLWGEAVRQRKPIIVNDFEQPNPFKRGFPQGHVGLQKYMSVPVIIDDKIVAVMGLANKLEDYDETDVNEMTMLLSGVWNTIQRRESTEKLAYERNKYYQTLLSIGEGIMVIDRNRNVVFLNPMACKLTGWPWKEARGANYKEVFTLSRKEGEAPIGDPIERVFSTGTVQQLGSSIVLISRQGDRYILEDNAAPVLDEAGDLAGVVLVFRDVTEKREQSKKIEYMSFHDALTDLYNRRFFEEELLRLDTPENQPITILMGDVDHLKLTNDIFGHASGDMLLKKVASAMRKVCRAQDVIARWGGDEFVLLLPQTDSKEAEGIAERIQRELSSQKVRAIRCSISLGYATKSHINEDILQTLSSAEAEMYATKSLARDTILNQGLNMVISALFEKSKEEQPHALRVRRLCSQLGKALSLSKSDLDRLTKAGYLHDIGKVIIDADQLKGSHAPRKPHSADMKMHPTVGYRILSAFDATLELAEAVLSHHENWDGSGYPKGLGGERIPLLARILAIVEEYDGLLNAMDYSADNSEAGSPASLARQAAVLAQIRRDSGTKFDPSIVTAFIGMLEGGAQEEEI